MGPSITRWRYMLASGVVLYAIQSLANEADEVTCQLLDSFNRGNPSKSLEMKCGVKATAEDVFWPRTDGGISGRLEANTPCGGMDTDGTFQRPCLLGKGKSPNAECGVCYSITYTQESFSQKECSNNGVCPKYTRTKVFRVTHYSARDDTSDSNGLGRFMLCPYACRSGESDFIRPNGCVEDPSFCQNRDVVLDYGDHPGTINLGWLNVRLQTVPCGEHAASTSSSTKAVTGEGAGGGEGGGVVATDDETAATTAAAPESITKTEAVEDYSSAAGNTTVVMVAAGGAAALLLSAACTLYCCRCRKKTTPDVFDDFVKDSPARGYGPFMHQYENPANTWQHVSPGYDTYHPYQQRQTPNSHIAPQYHQQY